MLGITTSYSIDSTDIEYDSSTHIIKCKVKTDPEISVLLRGPIESMLQKSLPFLKLNGDTLEVNIEESKAANILENLKMENNTITLDVNLKGLIK